MNGPMKKIPTAATKNMTGRSTGERPTSRSPSPISRKVWRADARGPAARAARVGRRLSGTIPAANNNTGMQSALPVSIERIAKWAKAAEGRGVLLVPISAMSNKAKSS